MSFGLENQAHFHTKSCAPRLILKEREKFGNFLLNFFKKLCIQRDFNVTYKNMLLEQGHEEQVTGMGYLPVSSAV